MAKGWRGGTPCWRGKAEIWGRGAGPLRTDKDARLSKEARQKAEEHKRSGLKVEKGLHLPIEARRIEDEEEHTGIEAEEEARLIEE